MIQGKAEKSTDSGQGKNSLDYLGRLLRVIHKTHHDRVIKLPFKVEMEKISFFEPARGHAFSGRAFSRDLKHSLGEIDTQYLARSFFCQGHGVMSGPAANVEDGAACDGRTAFQGLTVATLHGAAKELVDD